jgi:hypothetical protein
MVNDSAEFHGLQTMGRFNMDMVAGPLCWSRSFEECLVFFGCAQNVITLNVFEKFAKILDSHSINCADVSLI